MRRRITTAALVAVTGTLLGGCGSDPDTSAAPPPPPITTSLTFLAPPSPFSTAADTTTDTATEEPLPEPEPPTSEPASVPPTPVTTTEIVPPPVPQNPVVYQNGTTWDWLNAPGNVVPGGQLINIDNGFACSAGWITGVGDRRFVMVAGHCGAPGQVFAVPDMYGGFTVIGSMVESYVNGSSDGIFGVDIGLIELYPTTVVDPALPVTGDVVGWQNLAWLEATRPEICRLGFRTGLSCGPYYSYGNEGQFYYQGFSNAGDSGGPIFARYGGQLWAVGVMSAYDHSVPAAVAMSIGDWMPGWGLTLYTGG